MWVPEGDRKQARTGKSDHLVHMPVVDDDAVDTVQFIAFNVPARFSYKI